ncbi:HAMP domain-containing sensor histidine kinase [Paenibacillus sp. UNC499MF]|uniref:sensor histidine kinase n=1 Tax=Paenibacillus sp. UNC499MF TaxID=1502751 RepID=UPI00089FC33B|nr:sensor histidine kinase [Paenibacillus sp. UNC499MF]SEG47277.1 Signal transduction histidine kinase [Paenibacillus sp. UNC499MF]
MSLFWKDHKPLLLFYLAQMLLVPALYWLSGEGRPPGIVLYGMAISFAVLLLYFLFRYWQQSKLYKSLDDPSSAAAGSSEITGDSPLAEAFREVLRVKEQAYEQQLQESQSRMDRHIEFMNRWVHQMKTPLSVMQLTLRELEDEHMQSLQEELDRMRKGLETVLYTSRLDRFNEDFRVEPANLLRIVSESVAENRRLFIRKGIAAKLLVGESLEVYTDRKWLRFMLGQILTNAVNYSAGKGDSVSIAAVRQGRATVLEITDEGIGIAPEDLKRVFNPYFTGQRGRQYHESTGMGLYLVKEIAGKLGHAVELQSEAGAGTTVRIIFQPGHGT